MELLGETEGIAVLIAIEVSGAYYAIFSVTQPGVLSGYSEYKKSFGKEQAMKILQNEMVCTLPHLTHSTLTVWDTLGHVGPCKRGNREGRY